jgi:UDP-glucose 4-epimerase
MIRYSGKRILITGGAGFIGSHLVDALVPEQPASIHVVDNLFLGREENLEDARRKFPELGFHRLDATNGPGLRELLRQHRIEMVFNLATKALGHSFADPLDAFHVNVLIVGHLLEALRAGEIIHLVHFSSSEAYGTALQDHMAESHPLWPNTTYAAGKASADLMIQAYQQSFGTRVLILRPFNNYGPRQNAGVYAGIIPVTVTRILRGVPPVIFGDGTQTRDFIFVRDTARLAVELGKRDELGGSVINLGSGREVAIRDLINSICRISHYAGEVLTAPPRPGDVLRHCADVSVLRRILGDVPLRSMEEGLAETWQWYRLRSGANRRS